MILDEKFSDEAPEMVIDEFEAPKLTDFGLF